MAVATTDKNTMQFRGCKYIYCRLAMANKPKDTDTEWRELLIPVMNGRPAYVLSRNSFQKNHEIRADFERISKVLIRADRT